MKNIRQFTRTIMFTPEALLSSTSRQQCITKLNNLPVFIGDSDQKKNASVLVPVCVVNNEVCLLFTLRSSQLSSHSGQVSFPGGKRDEGEDDYQTALRETEEEIGVQSNDIDIWSKMCQVQGRAKDIVITPVVGELKNFDLIKLRRSESEVAEIFTVPLKVLCDKQNHGSFKYENIFTPVFITDKHKIWGITGLITHLFLQCLLPDNSYQIDFFKRQFRLEELMPAKL